MGGEVLVRLGPYKGSETKTSSPARDLCGGVWQDDRSCGRLEDQAPRAPLRWCETEEDALPPRPARRLGHGVRCFGVARL